MTAVAPVAGRGEPGAALALRLAWRELRHGVRGFTVFITCIALGVMAIAGVGSFARGLVDGLGREGRVILGGDLDVSLIHREATPAEQSLVGSKGRVSVAATLRAMARADEGRAALVEIKAVDQAYPLYGAVGLSPAGDLAPAIAEHDGVFGAAADATLLARLDLAPGARVKVGDATIEIRSLLMSEPDKLASGIGLGPRLLISEAALRATGLLQPGSLVRWHYRLQLPSGGLADSVTGVAGAIRSAFPDAGWEIRTRDNASPQLARNIERFSQFLTLVGLTALGVGGVGVANAVKTYLDRKRDVIATMKALGAPGGRIFVIYLAEVLILGLAGTALGLVIGAALPFVLAAALGPIIPLPIVPAIHPGELALAAGFGLLTAIAFALWPLGRVHDVPVSALFRDEVAPERRWPRKRYVALTAAAVVALALLAIWMAFDRLVAAWFFAASVAVFAVLRLVAAGLMAFARRLPRPRSALLRIVIANIHRPGALTPTVVLSLGLGLSLLVTLTLIDGNLRQQFVAALPERAPSFFFVDIQEADAARFDDFVRARAPEARLERVPMLRGRIVSANRAKASDLRPPPDIAWVLQGDRGLTYAGAVPAGSRVVAGDWWGPDYAGPPLVSLENRIADGLGLTLGDTIEVNVLGRNITARIANLRAVDWQSLGINFVMVFSPGTFRGAPHPHVATLTYPGGGGAEQELALLKAVADTFPAVTIVRVKDALDAISKVVLDLTLAVRGASGISLLAAVLVLAGALATGHRHRVYDAMVLRTLGATRARLVASYALEYLLLGFATAIFGVAAGSLAAAVITTRVMHLSFVWLPQPAIAAALAALALTVSLGLIGTFTALGQKPARVLRHL